jgi:hypothetical protein
VPSISEYLERYEKLDEPAQQKVQKLVKSYMADKLWIPNPGPQQMAMDSEADEIFFGGEAGGGKTDLVIGAAISAHTRSLILRRLNNEVRGIVDRMIEIVGSTDGYNGQLNKWRLGDRIVDFSGCQYEFDKEKFKGTPHDLKAFDEIGDFTESQFRFIKTWNRSANSDQRCRVICTGNPPTTVEGVWVIDYWAPWLDPSHPNPAKSGELRWYIVEGDEDKEVDGPGPYIIDGDEVFATSRTFIPSKLSDNPDLEQAGYAATLAKLRGEFRSAYRDGIFTKAIGTSEWQVIPSQWVDLAVERWTEKPAPGTRMVSMGVDIAMGGADKTVLSPLWSNNRFGELHVYDGEETPNPSIHFGLIMRHIRHGAQVNPDMGGGFGSGVEDRLVEAGIPVFRIIPGGGTTARTPDGVFEYMNVRAAMWWKFYLALDPDGPENIALPPDNQLIAELKMPKYEHRSRKILIESKKDIKKRLGRSTDKADAVIMAWYNQVENAVSMQRRNRKVTVNLGNSRLKQKYRKH